MHLYWGLFPIELRLAGAIESQLQLMMVLFARRAKILVLWSSGSVVQILLGLFHFGICGVARCSAILLGSLHFASLGLEICGANSIRGV